MTNFERLVDTVEYAARRIKGMKEQYDRILRREDECFACEEDEERVEEFYQWEEAVGKVRKSCRGYCYGSSFEEFVENMSGNGETAIDDAIGTLEWLMDNIESAMDM